MVNSKEEFNSNFGWKENLDGLKKPHFMIIGVTFAVEEALKIIKSDLNNEYESVIIFLTKANYADFKRKRNDQKYQELFENKTKCLEKLKPIKISIETHNIQTFFRNYVALKLASISLKGKSEDKITYDNKIKKRMKSNLNPEILRIYCEGVIRNKMTNIGIGIHIPNVGNKFDFSRGSTEIKTNPEEISVVAAIYGLRQALNVVKENKKVKKIFIYTNSKHLMLIVSSKTKKNNLKLIDTKSNLNNLIERLKPIEVKFVNRNKIIVNKTCLDKAYTLAHQAVRDLTKS